MDFTRDDTHTIVGLHPHDNSDPESASTAVEYALPTGFTDKAKAVWRYLDGSAFIFAYKGKLVMTDESLGLTAGGAGNRDSPYEMIRGAFGSWAEVESYLELCYDELKEEGLLDATYLLPDEMAEAMHADSQEPTMTRKMEM